MKTPIGVWLVAVLSTAGCSSVVIQKARLQKIRSMAVVSVFINERMPEVHGQGVIRKMDGDLRLMIAEDALAAINKALEDKGWETFEPQPIVEKPIYRQAFYKTQPGAAGSARANPSTILAERTFSPADMFPIWMNSESDEKPRRRNVAQTQRESLVELLAQLESDAAVMVQLRYCFRTFKRDRKERAVVTGIGSMQIADTKGTVLYESKKPQDCGGRERVESVTSVELTEEDWIYDPMKRDETRGLFREASREVANQLVGALPLHGVER